MGTQRKALKVFRHFPSVCGGRILNFVECCNVTPARNSSESHKKIPQSLDISLNMTYIDSSSRAEDGIHCRGILNAISNHKVP